MKSLISSLIGFVLSVSVSAAPLIEGQVRLESGEPVANAQVRIFDMTDLRRGAVAQATTDAAGYFVLPLASLGGSALPQKWTLGQNYPNPFNPSTIIPYHVPTAASVRLEVFNVLGQRVATLVDEERSAGVHPAAWNATDAAGRPVGAGVYFYRLSSAGQPMLTRRMVLLDGQAGQAAASAVLPTGPAAPVVAAEGVYGLAVTGAGLATYVDASFGIRSGMAPVEVVVEEVEGLPRGKALTSGVLGDANGDGQVTLDDVLLVITYVVDIANGLAIVNFDLSLSDVNGDGQVDVDDALLLITYIANPDDPSLPTGIGQAVPSSGGDWVAGAIRRLTPDWSRDPSWSPDGQHIAFESKRDDNVDIYVMASDGTNLRRLTTHSAWDYAPVWSPDGQHIAFWSERDDNVDIYVMASDGTDLRRLTTHSASDGSPAWSPDGQHIAFWSERDDNVDIYVMASDGTDLRRLTTHSAWDYAPVWSPDGQHIAFVSRRDRSWGRDIYVMASDGTNLRRLTTRSASDGSPAWSPDGQHIAWRDGYRDIYVMASDGTDLRHLTTHLASDESPGTARPLAHFTGDYYSPVWSPDGRHIAFAFYRDGDWDIYVIASDGTNLRRLTTHSAWDYSPVWSPDGRHIAFESERDGRTNIYVMELRKTGSDGTPFDAGDSPATATPVAVGESIEGELSAGDSDYFSVTVSNGGTLIASTTGSTDTYGSIVDSSANVLNENDDGGENRNFRVSAAVEPGTYYIRVRGFDASITGAYTLTLQMEENPVGSVETDRVALMTLFYNTDGTNWENNDRWGTDAPLDEWYRVGTDANGRVIELGLGGNQLSGSIPPELGNLTRLEVLHLWNNQLSGSIPLELGNLDQLRYLYLDGNQLSGSIPPELGNLTALRDLWLFNNQLSGSIPLELGNLTQLKGLRLNGNQLSGCIPAQLFNVEKNDLHRLELPACE